MRVPSASPSTRESRVRLVPLGGLGEIGMNCLAIEQGPDILIVDCGIRFPHDDLGVDVVHPDFEWILERADSVRGVFLTHGHEDHIGGLPYLLDTLEVPVFGPPHAVELARRRLVEHGFSNDDLDLRVAKPKERTLLGSFEVEPIRVAHSIVDATALSIQTRMGTLVHTGDFNLDADPPDGEPTDVDRLAALGRDGVALLLSDSTNIDVPERARSERDVGRTLRKIVTEAPGRVFVALFASNIQRLMLLGRIAEESGRKICALGRSLDMQIDIGTQIGRLAWPSDLRIPVEQARTLPKDRVLVLAGGTQGERNSAMSRLAAGTHQEIAIEADDTVVFSSRVIPGNDIAFQVVLSGLLRTGASVVTWMNDPGVHTSGHASRAEQTRMIQLLEPHCFLPVHGTLHHLIRHGALARELGVSSVAVVENGTPVVCDGRTAVPAERVRFGQIHVGIGGVELPGDILRQRTELARFGTATISVVLDRRGTALAPPTIVARGIPGLGDDADLRAISAAIARDLGARVKKRRQGPVADDIRRLARRMLHETSGVKPVVEVVVTEVD